MFSEILFLSIYVYTYTSFSSAICVLARASIYRKEIDDDNFMSLSTTNMIIFLTKKRVFLQVRFYFTKMETNLKLEYKKKEKKRDEFDAANMLHLFITVVAIIDIK